MSKYSEYLKGLKEKNMSWFFAAGYEMKSNKYFTFKNVINDDECILITNNIKVVKGSYALIVDNNKAVFLKDFQIKQVYNYFNDLSAFAIKLNRKYFKTYTFQNDFEDMYFEKEETFDDLMKAAKEQEIANNKWALC